MRFDFASFFREHGIDHLTAGRNVKRGWCNIQCPFCGPADPSHHMGCNPETGGFACYRDPTHKGRNTAFLVKALLGCSWEEARSIVGDDELSPGSESFADLERMLQGVDRPPKREGVKAVKEDPDFEEFDGIHAAAQPFVSYLRKRGYPLLDVPVLAEDYDLRFCRFGRWRNRLILPFLDGPSRRWVGWQGRAVGPAQDRYLSFPDSSAVKSLVFNAGPALEGGDVLVVVEGPLDCLKVDFFGRGGGVRAVGVLGTSWTDAQVACLFRLAPRYKRVLVLFDPGAENSAFELCNRLSSFRAGVGFVPDGVEDPGALEPDQVLPAIMACL